MYTGERKWVQEKDGVRVIWLGSFFFQVHRKFTLEFPTSQWKDKTTIQHEGTLNHSQKDGTKRSHLLPTSFWE